MLNKNRKAFSLLELIVAITAISIISTFIYSAYKDMQEIDRKSTMIREMDSIKKNMNERLKNLDILEGTLVSSEDIYYKNSISNTNEVAFPKDKFIKLDDTKEKKSFWGISNNQYKKYIYAQSKYFATTNGNIPYTDFWVIMVGPKLDKLYTEPEYMLKELFIFEKDKGLSTRFNKKFVSGAESNVPKVQDGTFDSTLDGYPIAQSNKMKENLFKQELKNIVIFKISTQEIVFEKYKETINSLNNYSKNLKDWASIQMSMYENIIAKYGGSYNIDYFVSLGVNATSSEIYADSSKPFKKERIYSSIDLDNTDNPIRESDGSEQGFTDILRDNFNSTNYGIVICGEKDSNICNSNVSGGNLSDTDIISLYDYTNELFDSTTYLPFEDSEVIIENAISLDSNDLLPGSKAIFGIGNSNTKVYNAFGEKYKFYFSNVKKWTVDITSPKGDSVGKLINNQNVPTDEAYAPYSATIFTLFPWITQELKDSSDPLSFGKEKKEDGYIESKIFPELR